MFCKYCGNQTEGDSKFCSICGKPLEDPQDTQQQFRQQDPYPGGYGYGADFRQDQRYQQQQFQPQQFQQVNKKQKNIGVIISVICCCIAVFAVCGTMIFMIVNNKNGGVKTEKSAANSSAQTVSSETADNGGDGTVTSVSDEGGENEEKKAASAEKKSDSSVEEKVEQLSFDDLKKQAEEKSNLQITYVSSDVSDYPRVKLYYTIKDLSGNYVKLDSPNIAVREKISDGKELEREIKSCDQLEGREGVAFDLVADKSGSMDSDMPSMKQIMCEFVDALDYTSGDKAELIAFDSFVMYMCTYTNDSYLLKNGINNMSTYDSTALYDALYQALLSSSGQKGARCIVAFTDGADNNSSHTADEVIALANTYSIPIFIIGTGSGDLDTYRNISYSTGGNYWTIDSIYDLSDILDQIYTQEKEMYCVEYVSDESADPYSDRNVECIISDGDQGAVSSDGFTPTETVKEKTHSSRYEVIKSTASWEEANRKCLEKGGHLITINDEAEMKKACKLAEKNGLKYVWMGGYTSFNSSGTYGHWITGENFGYEKWYPGEPSRNDHDGTNEMYLMLWKIDGEWSWNDQRNDPAADYSYFKGNMGYICEYEN